MSNQLVITCPIFNVDTKVQHCVELRTRVWRGENIGVRKGCQACMASNKCPITREFNKRGENDDFTVYTSPEPRHGKLRAQILEEIRPVIVQDQHLTKYAVSPTERDLIMTANDRIDAQLGSAPRKATSGVTRRSAPVKPKTKPVESSADKAAATGDLAAAINQAA